MPQPTQHSLIHVLLMWTAILSIIQVGFIILFFTGGHHELFQNKSNKASGGTMQIQADNLTSSTSENSLLLGKGKMLSFKGTEVTDNGTVKWIALSVGSGLVSEEGDILTIMKDGYYFLTLQVTLYSCTETQGMGRRSVSLKWDTKVLLQGTININTCSTGLLGKVEELSAGGTLVVTINSSTAIDSNHSLTHLDVIYMLKP